MARIPERLRRLFQRTPRLTEQQLRDQRQRQAEHNAYVKSRRTGEDARTRIGTAEIVRAARKGDQARKWGISFNAGLSDLRNLYGFDVVKMINSKLKTGGTVLEIGCGGGRAAREMQPHLGADIKIIATGVARLEEWKKPHNARLRFITTHIRQISKKIPAESVDFIHSNLGPFNVFFPDEYLKISGALLKKGGHIVFTSETNLHSVPKEFKLLKRRSTVIPTPNAIKDEATIYSYVLRKR